MGPELGQICAIECVSVGIARIALLRRLVFNEMSVTRQDNFSSQDNSARSSGGGSNWLTFNNRFALKKKERIKYKENTFVPCRFDRPS